MKNIFTHSKLYFFILIMILLGACSLNVDQNQNKQITQEDIDMVSLIIGESLSDDNSGMLGALFDAVSSISSQGFVLRKSAPTSQQVLVNDRSGRGNEQNLQYSFDPVTGEHIITFERFVDEIDFTKTTTDTLIYVYTDNKGSFVERPEQVPESIAYTFFNSTREGNILSPERQSFFVRSDTFLIDATNIQEQYLYVNGAHYGEGYFETTSSSNNSFLNRSYQLQVNFLDIFIEQNTPLLTQNLPSKISGSLTYSLTIQDPQNTSTSRTINGSIELVGDGTALLRIQQNEQSYQLNLNNGATYNQDLEFEGRIQEMLPANNGFKLVNGMRVELTENVEVLSGSDYQNLREVAQALRDGKIIRAEGYGQLNYPIFSANSIYFELESDNGDNEENYIDFDQPILSVNLENNSLVVGSSNLVVQLNASSIIESDSDFQTLEELNEALSLGQEVYAEGEASYDRNKEIPFQVLNIEFELKSSDSSGDDSDSSDDESDDQDEDSNDDDYDDSTDDDNDESDDDSEDDSNEDANDDDDDESYETEFEGVVESINLDNGIIQLTDGRTIRVNLSTRFEYDSISLRAAKAAVDEGEEVEVDGYANTDPEGLADLLAIKIDLEIETY